MAAGISNLTFDTMRGTLRPAAEFVSPLDRLGEDGRGYRRDGKKPAPSEFVTVKFFESAAVAQAHVDSCMALIGESTTMTDGREQTHLYVMVVDCQARILPCIHNGSAAFKVLARWLIEDYGT